MRMVGDAVILSVFNFKAAWDLLEIRINWYDNETYQITLEEESKLP